MKKKNDITHRPTDKRNLFFFFFFLLLCRFYSQNLGSVEQYMFPAKQMSRRLRDLSGVLMFFGRLSKKSPTNPAFSVEIIEVWEMDHA